MNNNNNNIEYEIKIEYKCTKCDKSMYFIGHREPSEEEVGFCRSCNNQLEIIKPKSEVDLLREEVERLGKRIKAVEQHLLNEMKERADKLKRDSDMSRYNLMTKCDYTRW